jgi:hypothetical protein
MREIHGDYKMTTPLPIRTAAQILAQQKADHAKPPPTPAVPATSITKAVALPDTRTEVSKYLDEIAPAAVVGRLVKFSKDGQFVTADDGEPISDVAEFVMLADETLIGWIRFNGEGEPPDRVMGLLYGDFKMPARDTLGDEDVSKWKNGLNGLPEDPWRHQVYVVLQNAESGELFTYIANSQTARRSVGHLLRHYTRLQRTHPDEYPVVRLKAGGFQHRDERVGWVATPAFAVVGRRSKESTARPDTSRAADFNDELPY